MTTFRRYLKWLKYLPAIKHVLKIARPSWKSGLFWVHNIFNLFTKYENKQTKTVGCIPWTRCILTILGQRRQIQWPMPKTFVQGYNNVTKGPIQPQIGYRNVNSHIGAIWVNRFQSQNLWAMVSLVKVYWHQCRFGVKFGYQVEVLVDTLSDEHTCFPYVLHLHCLWPICGWKGPFHTLHNINTIYICTKYKTSTLFS
jgi:hypothetical protein